VVIFHFHLHSIVINCIHVCVFVLDLVDKLGVGFYSTYLVAHKVILTSKHNDHDQYIWNSQPSSSFFLTKEINDQQLPRGTKITLFLKDDQVHKLSHSIFYIVSFVQFKPFPYFMLYLLFTYYCQLSIGGVLGRDHHQESH